MRQVVKIDANCRPIFEAVEVLDVAQIADMTPDVAQSRARLSSSASGPRASGLRRPLPMVAGGPLHIRVRILDIVNQNMTAINPHDFSYSYNGSWITGHQHSAYLEWNQENQTCSSTSEWGWRPQWNLSWLSVVEGGNGYSWMATQAHAEFRYVGGRFDCPYSDFYYNIIDTKMWGYGDGSPSECRYRFWAKNYAFGWQKETLCWDAYQYKFPGTF